MPPFRFNFGVSKQDAECDEHHTVVKAKARLFNPQPTNEVNDMRFVQIAVPQSAPDDVVGFKVYKAHIETSEAAAALSLEDITLADVIPGQYEGGFKLWEGAQDLMDIIVHQFKGPWTSQAGSAALSCIDGRILAMLPSSLQGTRVLELGCGHGLPGILCMLAGAEVFFHDLNKGVIETATYANVLKNSKVPGQEHSASLAKAHFIDGDFQSASDVLSENLGCRQFDLVLTAESIYNLESVPQLLAAFDSCLKPEGVILVAAKSYYFGVGGGVASFKRAVEKNGQFQSAVIARIDDGRSNIREVMLLRRTSGN